MKGDDVFPGDGGQGGFTYPAAGPVVASVKKPVEMQRHQGPGIVQLRLQGSRRLVPEKKDLLFGEDGI